MELLIAIFVVGGIIVILELISIHGCDDQKHRHPHAAAGGADQGAGFSFPALPGKEATATLTK